MVRESQRWEVRVGGGFELPLPLIMGVMTSLGEVKGAMVTCS